jgi:O-antigen ligase
MTKFIQTPALFLGHAIPENSLGNKIWLWGLFISLLSSILLAVVGIRALLFPLFLVIFTLMLRYSGLLLAVYFFSIPMFMYLFFELFTPLSLAFACLLIGYWIFRNLINPSFHAPVPEILIVYILCFFLAGVITGFHDGLTGAEMKTLLRLIVFFVFVYLIYDLFRPRQIFLIMTAMTIPLILSCFSLYKEYSQINGFISLLDLYRLKPGGIFPSSNLLGHVLMIAAPFWIALAIWHKHTIVRLVSVAVSILLGSALLLTNARASILGFGIAGLMFFIWARKVRYLIVLILIVAIILVSVPVIWNLISLGLRFERGTTSRDVIWANTVILIRQNPVFGVGLGNYASKYDPLFSTAYERWFMKTVPNAHLFPLSMVVDLGIAGFFLALAIYILPVREAIRALRKARSNLDRAVIYGIFGGIIAIYGRSLFETGGIVGSGRPYPDILFWLLFCILLKINKTVKEPTDHIFSHPSHTVSRT